jgi:hypothetical protein
MVLIPLKARVGIAALTFAAAMAHLFRDFSFSQPFQSQ